MNQDLPHLENNGPGLNDRDHEPLISQPNAGRSDIDQLRIGRLGVSHFARLGRVLLTGALAGCLLISAGPAGVARADNLDDQASNVQAQIQSSEDDIVGNHAALDEATAVLSNARDELADAQAALAKANSERDAAIVVDTQMAEALKKAEAELMAAQLAVQKGKSDVAEQLQKVGRNVRQTTQQSTDLQGIGLLLTNIGTGDISNRVQWSQTLFGATQRQLGALQEAQGKLEAAERARAEAEQQAQTQRQQAAAHVQLSQQAAQNAQQAAADVAAKLAAREAAQNAAEQALAQAQAANAALQAQSAEIERQIQARNAAAAARAAAGRASEAARAAAQQAAESANTRSLGYSNSSDLIDPVPGAPITSPYGRRLNPVVRVWEFHDGVDLGANCGTPIHAAASGSVAQVLSPGQSGGYGNRMVIDHGVIGGRYVSTGYNHAQSFIVGPGAYVSQGQVIGYVGSTGLSTGCHLHFHVYVNGHTVDPLSMVSVG